MAQASCPDPFLPAETYNATGPDLIAPQSWAVQATAEAQVPCADWAENDVLTHELVGYLPIAPSAVFNLEGMAPHILMVMADAQCDPILAVRSGDGLWHFGQSANDRQEVVVWGAPDGPLQVWVGSARQTSCDATVILETFDR
ncbi:hypothetical protein PSJ8397_03162 [Pseudooctadecabacter jejudonensis]|uniref:Uncharacterized protein n=2 Tax=Pseudooctadecabacter jejudonensis TaxID=1391910 RepID=A0A1Y5TDE5_9RHOB|nr:hypothetical protein PSJ8397_03162 [Pseudooctadecabacter jejudonensis]